MKKLKRKRTKRPKKKWSKEDINLYSLVAIPTWLGFTAIAFTYMLIASPYALIGYILIYLLLVLIQARDWCPGCPYRGKECPGIYCMFAANWLSSVAFKKRKFKYSKNKELFVGIISALYYIYPLLFLYINIPLLFLYLFLLASHTLFIWKVFCPHCAFRRKCPSGKISSKLFQKTLK